MLRHRKIDAARGPGRTGEANTIDTRVRHQHRPHPHAVAGQQLQHIPRNTGLVHQGERARRDQRRFFGRLCDDSVTGSQRGEYLPGEDCERKVPRRNTGNDPARGAFAGTTFPDRLICVEAGEVACLAHFPDTVGQGLARLPRHQCKQFRRVHLVKIGHAAHAIRPVLDPQRRPGSCSVAGHLYCRHDIRWYRFRDIAYDIVGTGRIPNFPTLRSGVQSRDGWPRLPPGGSEPLAFVIGRGQLHWIGKIPTLRVSAFG